MAHKWKASFTVIKKDANGNEKDINLVYFDKSKKNVLKHIQDREKTCDYLKSVGRKDIARRNEFRNIKITQIY